MSCAGILVESARRRDSRKRGGSVCLVSMDGAGGVLQSADAQLITLDDAQSTLMEIDPRKTKVHPVVWWVAPQVPLN